MHGACSKSYILHKLSYCLGTLSCNPDRVSNGTLPAGGDMLRPRASMAVPLGALLVEAQAITRQVRQY